MMTLNDYRMKYANPGKFGMPNLDMNAFSSGGMAPNAYAMGGMAPSAYAQGGKVNPLKRNELIIAHVGRGELDDLEDMQGHRERDPQTNLRSFSKLEQLFNIPEIANKFTQLAMGGMAPSAYAHGGLAQNNMYLNRLARNGMNGDTELAIIGPHTREIFDRLAQARGGLTVNPYDGHPQYFSLGGLFSGIGNAFKSVINPIASSIGLGGAANSLENLTKPVQNLVSGALNQAQPVLGQLAPAIGTTIGSRFGNPELGNMVGQIGAQLLNNNQQQPLNQTQQNLYHGANTMLNNLNSGQNFRQAAGNTLGSMGSRFGGGAGTAMNMAGAALNTPGQFTPRNVASNVYNQMGGAQGLASQAYNLGRSYLPNNPMLHGAIQGGIQNMQYGPAGAAMGALGGAAQNAPFQPIVEPMGAPYHPPYESPYVE